MADDSKKADPKQDLFWVLGVFVVIGVMWFYSGGVERSSDVSDSRDLNDQNLFEAPEERTIVDIGDDIKTLEREVERLEREVKEAREAKEASPLKGSAFISADRASLSGPNGEYIRIQISSSLKDKLLITGWELYSPMTGRSARIGQGVSIPKLGEQNFIRLILASPGDTIFVSTGRSPIGFSFRTNFCSGYLSQFQSFEPRIRASCPYPEEEASYLSAGEALPKVCTDFLKTIPGCEVYVKSYPAETGEDCRVFVESNLNYNACVNNHLGDTKFPGNEWYVYLNEDVDIWRDRAEVIKLLDENGKTIDVASYE